MLFFNWLRNRKSVVRSFRNPLTLEALEDRCTPAAGFLDPTFDGDGVATTRVGGGTLGFAHDVAVYPAGAANAGKIVVVGSGTPTTGSRSLDCSLVR